MTKPCATGAGIIATIVCGSALCAPHLEPCKRIAGYQENVERIMRAASADELELLVVIYGPLTEHGIGLARVAGGFDLLRLELDKSFWYSSWRDAAKGDTTTAVAVATEVYRADGKPLGAQVLDFSNTKVRVATSSVPIGEELGSALLDFFERRAATAHVEAPGIRLLDGITVEILLAGPSCAALTSPPPGSDASGVARLVSRVYEQVPAWQPWAREAFEADLLGALPD